jgi:hypothetical protein
VPAILARVEEEAVRRELEAQLERRYGREYEISCFGDADGALQAVPDVAHGGADVALVLVGASSARGAGAALLDRVRQLHPQAKRALLVPPAGWTDPSTADLIRSLMALGRIDHYVLVVSGPRGRTGTTHTSTPCRTSSRTSGPKNVSLRPYGKDEARKRSRGRRRGGGAAPATSPILGP